MKHHSVNFNIKFNAPVEKVYGLLSDHVTLGKILGVNMKRIVDSKDAGNPNGVGSVRRFTIGLPMEETVVKAERNKLIDYTITKGMHFFSSHYGTMVFKPLGDSNCELDYTITIGIKFPILSKVIMDIIGMSIRGALNKLKKQLSANPNYSVASHA